MSVWDFPSQASEALSLYLQPGKSVDQYWLTCLALLVTLRVEEVVSFWFSCRELKHKTHPRSSHLFKEWFEDIRNSKPTGTFDKIIYFTSF